MLTFNLKKEWYEKIKSGEKTTEYREVKQYWTWRLIHSILRYGNDSEELSLEYLVENEHPNITEETFIDTLKETEIKCNFPCIFRLGYTKELLNARIISIEVVNGKDTDLHIDKDVYAIHFRLM